MTPKPGQIYECVGKHGVRFEITIRNVTDQYVSSVENKTWTELLTPPSDFGGYVNSGTLRLKAERANQEPQDGR